MRSIILLCFLTSAFFLSACSRIQVESRPDIPSAVKLLDPEQEKKDVKGVQQLKRSLAAQDKNYSSFDFKLMSRNGILISYGRLPSQQSVNLVRKQASSLGFRQYFHRVIVGSPRTYLQSASDSDLALKIKGALLSSYLDASIIKSDVYSNTAYLLGVLTPEQGKFVKELISKIQGIQTVVVAFEYIQPPSYTSDQELQKSN